MARQEDAVTHIYTLMANLALERGLLKQAEQLFTTVIKRLIKYVLYKMLCIAKYFQILCFSAGEPEDSNAIVEISLKIAQIFHADGENLKAEQGYKYCAECQRKKVAAAGKNVDEDTLGKLHTSHQSYMI